MTHPFKIPDRDTLYKPVSGVIGREQWDKLFADDIEAILRLKHEKNAVILAHNYQTPEIFHCVADICGDSLALARAAQNIKSSIIVMAGVYFMAETVKLLNPQKKVLIPDRHAGCSLAEGITAQNIIELKKTYPNVPVVTYVNSTADVKAHSDICCTSGNAKAIVESLNVPRVIMVPDEFLAKNIQAQTNVDVITWPAHCEVHKKFTPQQIKQYRRMRPGIDIIAHPECSPEVIKEADHSGSTKQMVDYIEKKRPKEAMLITECSMSDNLVTQFPDVKFTRPCNLCPHMKRITLSNIRRSLENEQDVVDIPHELQAPARKTIERMLAA